MFGCYNQKVGNQWYAIIRYLDLVQSVYNELEKWKGNKSRIVLYLKSWNMFLNKNWGFKKIWKVSKIINVKVLTEEDSQIELDLSPEEMASFITNCEVEKSFSKYIF